jgi:hypothetical protein
MKYPKRSQYKYAKSSFRIRNWPEYEAGLRNRGDLTVWLSSTAFDAWRETPSGKPGGQRTYADIAIEAALTIRMVFHLPLRQTEGFLLSLADLLGWAFRSPITPPFPDGWKSSVTLASGDWSQRNPSTCSSTAQVSGFTLDTGEVLAADLTNRRTADCARVPGLMDQIDDRVASVTADGAYDAGTVYGAAKKKGDGHRVRVLFPPIHGPQPSSSRSPGQWERNWDIREARWRQSGVKTTGGRGGSVLGSEPCNNA